MLRRVGPPWSNGPFLKISEHVPRVMSAEATLGTILPLARAVPITRIADISPLDRSRFPVFCAVTPLAADLTTHLGKGAGTADAKASAVMEAIERHCAEYPACEVIRATHAEMARRGCHVAERTALELSPDRPFGHDAPLRWARGDCLLTGRKVWLPADLVQSPPSDGVVDQPDTNGLASGNTHLEALLHGLSEVIERDAVSQFMFAEAFADPGEGPQSRRIDPRTLPERSRGLLAGLQTNDRFVVIDDLTVDIAVPVMRAMIVDPSYPGASGPGLRVFAGYGCHPSSEVAVNRALTEAAQALIAVVQGARDSFNEVALPRRAAARQAAMTALQPAPLRPFGSVPDFRSDDLRRDLDHMLGAIEAAGFRNAIAFDLTRRDLGVPVVRVRVPGMASFVVDRNRIGWRCLRWLQ